MPTPSSDCRTLPLATCPHPVRDSQQNPLCMPTPSSTVKLHLCMSMPSSALSNSPTPSSRLSNLLSECPHPVRDCQTLSLHAHTQFETVELPLCMPTPSTHLTHPVRDCQTPSLHVHMCTQFDTVELILCPHTVRHCRTPSACQVFLVISPPLGKLR